MPPPVLSYDHFDDVLRKPGALIVYTWSACSYCVLLKNFLEDMRTKRGVNLLIHYVTPREASRVEFQIPKIEKFPTVYRVDIEGVPRQLMEGFNERAIAKELLDAKDAADVVMIQIQ
jgi:glutaredoxin